MVSVSSWSKKNCTCRWSKLRSRHKIYSRNVRWHVQENDIHQVSNGPKQLVCFSSKSEPIGLQIEMASFPCILRLCVQDHDAKNLSFTILAKGFFRFFRVWIKMLGGSSVKCVFSTSVLLTHTAQQKTAKFCHTERFYFGPQPSNISVKSKVKYCNCPICFSMNCENSYGALGISWKMPPLGLPCLFGSESHAPVRGA